MSLPLRKCGLKYEALSRKLSSDAVTSLAEVWIEITLFYGLQGIKNVTSLAEVWIEILL